MNLFYAYILDSTSCTCKALSDNGVFTLINILVLMIMVFSRTFANY